MELEKLINADIKAAMLAKDSQKLAALRAIKAAILLAKTDKKSGGDDIAEEAEMQILKRLVKQRKESAALYTETGRDDLVKEELFQASVIEAYLPEQLSEEIIREEVKKIIEVSGAVDMKDMGKVMGMATKSLSGKADNKLIANLVREMLSP